MRGYSLYISPAGAAIAAVLALGSTYAYAQETASPVTPVPAETVAAPPPASVPVIAPSQPVVQPTQSVDERIAAAVAASQAEAAAEPKAPPAQRAARVSAPERQKPAGTASPAPAAREMVRRAPQPQQQQSVPPAAPPVEVVDPAVPEAAPVAASAPEPPAIASDADNDALYWALGGGGLLLMGLGGAAASRRRRSDEEALIVETAAPVLAQPVMAERAPVEPVVRRDPATAYTAGLQHGTADAMAAAPPSAENPFRTHSKRMRRARFLLAQAERRDAARQAPATMPAPPQTIHAEPKMQTVYRLGGDRDRQMGFKPQTR